MHNNEKQLKNNGGPTPEEQEYAALAPHLYVRQVERENQRLLLDLSEFGAEVARMTRALSDCEKQLAEARKNCMKIEESTPCLLGRTLITGFGSFRDFLRLPGNLLEVRRIARERERLRQKAEQKAKEQNAP